MCGGRGISCQVSIKNFSMKFQVWCWLAALVDNVVNPKVFEGDQVVVLKYGSGVLHCCSNQGLLYELWMLSVLLSWSRNVVTLKNHSLTRKCSCTYHCDIWQTHTRLKSQFSGIDILCDVCCILCWFLTRLLFFHNDLPNKKEKIDHLNSFQFEWVSFIENVKIFTKFAKLLSKTNWHDMNVIGVTLTI